LATAKQNFSRQGALHGGNLWYNTTVAQKQSQNMGL
jgi:hypothetical protein